MAQIDEVLCGQIAAPAILGAHLNERRIVEIGVDGHARLALLFDEIHEALRNAVFEDHAVGIPVVEHQAEHVFVRAAPRHQKIAVVGDDAFQPGEHYARKAVARVGFLRTVGVHIGDDSGGVAHQRPRGHVGHIMQLVDGRQNALHRLRGNAVVVAMNDIGNGRQTDADEPGDILHCSHEQVLPDRSDN